MFSKKRGGSAYSKNFPPQKELRLRKRGKEKIVRKTGRTKKLKGKKARKTPKTKAKRPKKGKKGGLET